MERPKVGSVKPDQPKVESPAPQSPASPSAAAESVASETSVDAKPKEAPPGEAVQASAGAVNEVPKADESKSPEKESAEKKSDTKPPETQAKPAETQARPVVGTAKAQQSTAGAPPKDDKPKVDPRLDPERYGPPIENPKNHQLITIRPGKSQIVLINFVTGTTPGRYKLEVKDDERPENDGPLVERVRYDIDTAANAPDQLAFRIDVPDGYPPVIHRLRVSYGPISKMESLVLMVQVLPTLGLRLRFQDPVSKARTGKTEEFKERTRRVFVGPVHRIVETELVVSNAGNLGTGYRLVPREAAEAGKLEKGLNGPELYKSGQWNIVFDRELEELTNRPGARVEHRVRFRHRGIWWFGFWSKRPALLTATPVTDPPTANLGDNFVQLTGIAWRLSPLPWFLWLPLLLVLLMIISNLRGEIKFVSLAADPKGGSKVVHSSDGPWFVLQNEPAGWTPPSSMGATDIKAQLNWGPDLRFVKFAAAPAAGDSSPEALTRDRDGALVSVSLDKSQYERRVGFTVGPSFGSGGKDASAEFLSMRTFDKFRFTPDCHGTLSKTDREPVDGNVLPSWTIDLYPSIDQSVVHIAPINLSDSNRIDVFLVKKSEGLDVIQGPTTQSGQQLAPRPWSTDELARLHRYDDLPSDLKGSPWKLPTSASTSTEFVVATTDGALDLIRFRLHPRGAQ